MSGQGVELARLALAALTDEERADMLRSMATPPAAPGRALTLTACAKAAGLSRGVIYRALATRALHAVKLYSGARPRISEADFHAWLAGRGAA